MYGYIIFGAIIIGVLSLIGIIASILTISRKRWAKEQAKRMLDEGKVDMTVIERTLQLLAETRKDLQAETLFRQLNDLLDGQGQRR
jgi:hypothetical protein